MNMTQERRHRAAILTAWGCWLGAAALTTLSVLGILARPYGVAVVFLIGVAIAAGMSLSRMRLSHTMKEVFAAGLSLALNRIDEHEEASEERANQ